jgi:hypothetical protein
LRLWHGQPDALNTWLSHDKIFTDAWILDKKKIKKGKRRRRREGRMERGHIGEEKVDKEHGG